MAECSGFAVIGCLGIRLGPVSFHARDDNNGCHCRDDCWHHYSCVLPHASIFTCCTDAPEVNEFFTLEFRAGSHRHIPSRMRGAQHVNQKTYTAHFSFPSLFFPQYQITLALFNSSTRQTDITLYMIWRVSGFWSRCRCMMLSSSMACRAADVACFKRQDCQLVWSFGTVHQNILY